MSGTGSTYGRKLLSGAESTSGWKILSESMRSTHGGRRVQWTPGVKRSARGDLALCERGLHYCRTPGEVLRWLGPVICPCEVSPEHLDGDDKGVARWLIIGEPIPTWNECSARHFACDCAEYALRWVDPRQREPLQACIDITRAYADWPDQWHTELDAAHDMAYPDVLAPVRVARSVPYILWDIVLAVAQASTSGVTYFARSTPWAWNAARSVALNTARAVAQASTRYVGDDTTWVAAYNSAWDTTWADLAAILATYLDGTSEWVQP